MNPYDPPQLADDAALAAAPLSPAEARVKVRLAAYGLISTAALGLAFVFAATILALILPMDEEQSIFSPQVDRVMILANMLVIAGLQVMTLRGGLAMLRLSRYRTARWGALLAAASLGGTCLLGFPFAVWALLLLYDARIRGAFTD